jgi:hypothetical protein
MAGIPTVIPAEGDLALFNLTTGFDYTAIGSQALFSNTTDELSGSGTHNFNSGDNNGQQLSGPPKQHNGEQ